ncbi:MAG: hypothetical protein EBS19_16680 [Spirochaetia bacterium]|nr:hypothetical protein [Spirochaetia bacterium]
MLLRHVYKLEQQSVGSSIILLALLCEKEIEIEGVQKISKNLIEELFEDIDVDILKTPIITALQHASTNTNLLINHSNRNSYVSYSNSVDFSITQIKEFGEKHSKFPLQPDEIASNFVDKMEDVSLFQKIQLERIYEIGKQQIDTSTAEVSQILKNNTEKRLGQNKFYQEFVTYIKNLENESEENVKFQNADFQMEEAINVIKDFIMIQKTKEKAA